MRNLEAPSTCSSPVLRSITRHICNAPRAESMHGPHLVLLHGCRQMRLQRVRDCKRRYKWVALLLQGLLCALDWRGWLLGCELHHRLTSVVEAHLLEAGCQRCAAAAIVMRNGCASCKKIDQPGALCESDCSGGGRQA